MRKFFFLSLGGFVLMVSSISCSAVHHDEGEPTVKKIYSGSLIATLSLPLDEYRLVQGAHPEISRANDLLVRACMHRFGLQLPMSPALPVLDTKVGQLVRRYGITDVRLAAIRGYHGPSISPLPDNSTKNVTPLLPATEGVLVGTGQNEYAGKPVPVGGCLGDAHRRLAIGGSDVNERLGEDLSFTSFQQSEMDSRVLDAISDWQKCMSVGGFNYSRPRDAINDPQFAGPQPSKVELKVASADIACKSNSNLVGIWYSVEVGYQQRLIREKSDSLSRLKQSIAAQERNATAVLAAS